MTHKAYIWVGIFIMFLTTYLVRALPVLIFRRRIKSVFVQSFLYYVPYSVLAAMTFPAVFYCTNSLGSALAGTAAALVLAYRGLSLVSVAIVSACVTILAGFLGI